MNEKNNSNIGWKNTFQESHARPLIGNELHIIKWEVSVWKTLT